MDYWMGGPRPIVPPSSITSVQPFRQKKAPSAEPPRTRAAFFSRRAPPGHLPRNVCPPRSITQQAAPHIGLAESKTSQVKRAFLSRRIGGPRQIAPPPSISKQTPQPPVDRTNYEVKNAFLLSRRRIGTRPIAPPKSIIEATKQAHLGVECQHSAMSSDVRAVPTAGGPSGLRQIIPPGSVNFGGSGGTNAFVVDRPDAASCLSTNPGRRAITPPKSISEQPVHEDQPSQLLSVGNRSSSSTHGSPFYVDASPSTNASAIGMPRGVTPPAGAAPSANLFGPASMSSPLMKTASPASDPLRPFDRTAAHNSSPALYQGNGLLSSLPPVKGGDGYAQRGIVTPGVTSSPLAVADSYMDQHVKAQAARAPHRPRSPRQSAFSLEKVAEAGG